MYPITRLPSILLACYLALAALWQPALAQQTPDATEIVRRADQKMRGESSRSEITMRIVRPSWERELSLKGWSLGSEFSLILVTAPARDAGTAYLKRGNEIWHWLPDINRTVKLPPSMMSQSWMGSDFSNNDLVRESSIVSDYEHSLAGDSTVSGRECWRIEMTPKPDAPVVWGTVVSYISKQEYLQLRTEFYDEEGLLVKTMEGSDIASMDGRTIPTRMVMIPADEAGHRTELLYHSLAFDVGLEASFFSTQNMKRVE
ncbi:MAG: outer membrane lipoprotein-sorting protein [Balneolaceae bacterium]|nr:outer membrane lipoprotein-sorting protein [Balneolaceae bacterium]